jgi:hypothetical protein
LEPLTSCRQSSLSVSEILRQLKIHTRQRPM